MKRAGLFTGPQVVVAAVGVVLLAAIWAGPSILLPYSHMDIYDAPLRAADIVVFTATLAASLAVLGVGLVRNWAPDGLLALGVMWVALAPVGLFAFFAFEVFGPQLDLEYWMFVAVWSTALTPAATAVLILAILGGLVGVTTVVLTMLVGRDSIRALPGAVAAGFLAAAVIAFWIGARGHDDWDFAPCGLDVYLVLALAAAALVYVGTATPWLRLPTATSSASPA